MAIDVRPASSRFHTELDWLDSWHSFSFGTHYDPGNVGHGLLIVNNDDTVRAGGGFGTHGHRDMEIVTWVLDGELGHRDSTGTDGVIYPGLAQRMSAGSGIRHSEMNASATADVHFVQMWVPPDTARLDPGYEQLEIADVDLRGRLAVVASGLERDRDRAAIRIEQRAASLQAARLDPGDTVQLPMAPFVHLYVARGAVDLEGSGRLDTGDAARVANADGQRVTAVDGPAEVLVWEMHALLR